MPNTVPASAEGLPSAQIIRLVVNNEKSPETLFLESAAKWAAPIAHKHLSAGIAECDYKLFANLTDALEAIRDGKPLSLKVKRAFLWELDYLFVLEMRVAAGNSKGRVSK